MASSTTGQRARKGSEIGCDRQFPTPSGACPEPEAADPVFSRFMQLQARLPGESGKENLTEGPMPAHPTQATLLRCGSARLQGAAALSSSVPPAPGSLTKHPLQANARSGVHQTASARRVSHRAGQAQQHRSVRRKPQTPFFQKFITVPLFW